MRSMTLDAMTMDDVLTRAGASAGDDRDYWVRIAKAKLAEYRRLMPGMAKIVGPSCDWRARGAVWQAAIDAITTGATPCPTPDQ